jgi:hypothetical protein
VIACCIFRDTLYIPLVITTGQGVTGLYLLQSQAACPVVLVGDELQGFNNLGVLALANEEFGRFSELDHKDTREGHHEDECAVGEPDVAPALVVAEGTIGGTGAGVIRQESPGEKAGDKLTHAPPGRHEGDHPLVLAGDVLEENGRVEDEVSTTAERRETDEETKDGPVRGGSRNDRKDGGDHEGDVEGELATDYVCREAPEQSANEHTDIDGNSETCAQKLDLVCTEDTAVV